MKNPFLIGDTIYLRAIEESDLTERYQNWFNDEEICQFNSHHRFPNYRQDMESYYRDVIQSDANLVLAICDKKTNDHVGNISLQDIDPLNRTAELAIIIGEKDYWSRGVGRDAVHLILRHGFTALNLHRIHCGTLDTNIGMQKLAEKVGFKNEGRSRQDTFKGGVYHDTILYGVLQGEYVSDNGKEL